ncbi:MAG TPA: glycoside hydrolase family 2 TIM barrel-domain containing protein [Candidatus Binatia bacterium]|nr:glycoside hydrolase family 2 TIM barrel-domain containing protein [Candidatus Binatia bacterium]
MPLPRKTLGCLAGICIAASLAVGAPTPRQGRLKLNLNPVWRFHLGEPQGEPAAATYDDSRWDIVSLPHSHQIFSANLIGFSERGRNSGWYRREFQMPPEWRGKKLFIEFQGAMQTTALWVNGKKVGDYAVSGYDPFDFDITAFVSEARNVIAVKVDDRPDPDIPPDGRETDYILFGGLYRDVFLHVTEPVHLTFPWEARKAGLRLTLPEVSEKQAIVQAETIVRNDSPQARKCVLVTEIREQDGKLVASLVQEQEIAPNADYTFNEKSEPIANPHLWSPDAPYLYQVHTIIREGDRELDRQQTALGIRWVKFDKERGFFLNGHPLKLIGANRHQTWPFIGNAVPNSLQRRDAEQLKAMGVNWVRLSHYPQDPDFLDALDELGLMALEEPPTWMLAGSEKWMANLETSFRSMIRRDRNHPCIIVWGACVNHHEGDRALVRAAIEEDPTRERGQDTVPLPMAFTPQNIPGKGALVIEHTGHTFPAERGARFVRRRLPGAGSHDIVVTNINREYEQTERNWQQVNAAYQKPDNCGLAVWCMYDYNTFHNINEQGLVWHGVCDLFRIPKFSYFWHQSELTTTPMAYIVRIDDTHAAVFSNCEQVRLWQDTGAGYKQVATQKPDAGYTASDGQQVSFALHHPPFHFAVAPNAFALKAEGFANGITKTAYEWRRFGDPVALTLEADRPTITADGSDLSRVIVTAIDTNGTPVDTCKASITFTIDGLGQLVGDNPVKLRAGKMIILAQSGFVPDDLTITATSPGLRPASVKLKTMPVPSGVDMPKDLPAKQPTHWTPQTTASLSH